MKLTNEQFEALRVWIEAVAKYESANAVGRETFILSTIVHDAEGKAYYELCEIGK